MKKGIRITIVLLVILSATMFYYKITSYQYPAVREYVPGGDGMKGKVDVTYFNNLGSEFAIGANEYGYAVFKDPKKAFDRMKQIDFDGLKLIKKEHKLNDINRFNYKSYLTYGAQITNGTKEAQKQALEVSAILDIYENSFTK